MAPKLDRELGMMRIAIEELGKTEMFRGEDVYTHMVFAEKILDPAKQARVKASTSGLWNVQDELPEILHGKIPENQTSWTAFAQAIKDVNMGHIQEEVREYKVKAAEAKNSKDHHRSSQLTHQSNQNPVGRYSYISTAKQSFNSVRPIQQHEQRRGKLVQCSSTMTTSN